MLNTKMQKNINIIHHIHRSVVPRDSVLERAMIEFVPCILFSLQMARPNIAAAVICILLTGILHHESEQLVPTVSNVSSSGGRAIIMTNLFYFLERCDPFNSPSSADDSL